MKKGNISIFVPHLGCPCECSFCNQKTITGQTTLPTPDDVRQSVEKALEKDSFSYEIAFFGGSFTAIEEAYMISLLEAAYDFVKSGQVDGIRISTRPDCINSKVLSILRDYGVTSIELGAQSMDDTVLSLNRRGHTALQVEKASEQIKKAGFSLGLQMMTGLYGDNDEKALLTAKKLIALSPDTVRIYPTVVLKGTYLAQLYEQGIYEPQSLDDALNLTAQLVSMFEENGISVIRLGLHSSEDIKSNHICGAFHDSFGEMVRSRIMLNELMGMPPGCYNVFIHNKSISKLIGNKKQNIAALRDKGYGINITIDNNIVENGMRIENGLKNA